MHSSLEPSTKNRLFWKIGLIYPVMLLLVLMVLDTYVVRALKREYVEAAISQLESISRLALSEPPRSSAPTDVAAWSKWLALSGVRITLIANDGKVLADSDENPARMENHRGRPEIRDAFAKGLGRSVRYSATLKHDLVYFARRFDMTNAAPLVMRFSLPVYRLDEGIAGFRKRLWGISLLVLVLAGGASLFLFRRISNRIGRLTEFSHRVSEGDFRPMSLERTHDELADLSSTLNQTALKLDQTIRALTEERNQSAAILASMEEAVAVINTDQRVIFCNIAFREAAGISNTDWENRPAVELIRHSDLLAMIQRALTGNEVIHGEVVVGSVRTRSFAVTSAPVRSDAFTTGAVMVLHDITEIRRLERARRDFVANVSHEFRTPLTAIRGFAETLLEGALDDAGNRRRFIEIILDHALRLGRLTDDLLRLAQIEAGQLQLEVQPVAVSTIIEPCIETTRVKAEQKDLILDVQFDTDLPPLQGDVRSLQGVLQELLDNAVRYSSPGGRIAIKTALKGEEVMLSVSDTGIGIPKTDQERIFERFYRTDPARSRESGGTGLGLSIAKHMIEAHHGRIKVESEVGKGSTFYIILPVRTETARNLSEK
jgi:two-component system phosphate regulon sensor histidine kinase PhoR